MKLKSLVDMFIGGNSDVEVEDEGFIYAKGKAYP